jgi:hypothetical protein
MTENCVRIDIDYLYVTKCLDLRYRRSSSFNLLFLKKKEEKMIQARPTPNQPENSNPEALREHTAIDRIVEMLAPMDHLPAKEQGWSSLD